MRLIPGMGLRSLTMHARNLRMAYCLSLILAMVLETIHEYCVAVYLVLLESR